MIRIRRNTLWWHLWRFNCRWSIMPDLNAYDTNLCQFMRCLLIWLPLKFLSVALALSAIVVWWDEVWLGLAAGVGIFGFIASLLVGAVYADRHNIGVKVTDTLVWQYVKAKKQKICPLVVIE